MRSLIVNRKRTPGRPAPARRPARVNLAVEQLETRLVPTGYVQTNLVSDVPNMAQTLDPNLKNPWGISETASSAFWVSDNNSGLSTLYNTQGAIQPLMVTIPPAPAGATLGSPTGTVANTTTTGFVVSQAASSGPATFIFATEDGTISGWNFTVNSASAIVEVNKPGADFTGLAIDTDALGHTYLYAADFAHGTIDVFNTTWQQVSTFTFHDPALPANFVPFNIQAINKVLYVEYAQINSGTHAQVPGLGHGIVDTFHADGVLIQRLISNNITLNEPWGVAVAPAGFGQFSGDLLVGNFGDGTISGFNPTTGAFQGRLFNSAGGLFQESDLWALTFGNGVNGGLQNALYFTAGINGEADGLFGSLQAPPPIAPSAPILPALPGALQQSFSTVPANGDLNPYGVAFVPQGIAPGGKLRAGDVLVANFNDSTNAQGTGSTIVQITPAGQRSVFFQGADGLGLSTALGVLKSGFVIVGTTPLISGGGAGAGELLILDSNGNVVTTLTDSAFINGAWDLTVFDLGSFAEVFVSSVLTGTVSRIDMFTMPGSAPVIESITMIASGYAHRTDPNAFVIGPTGLAFDPLSDTLYVASTGDNAIFAVKNAALVPGSLGRGKMIYQDSVHLHGPLGLTLAPNGDLITANGDAVNPDANHPNELVEFTPAGKFVAQFQLDPGNPGGAFGLAFSIVGGEIRFAAVNDNQNTLEIFTLQQQPIALAAAFGSRAAAPAVRPSPQPHIGRNTSLWDNWAEWEPIIG
jgi:uncharacterized protein (TIGR03118 family)